MSALLRDRERERVRADYGDWSLADLAKLHDLVHAEVYAAASVGVIRFDKDEVVPEAVPAKTTLAGGKRKRGAKP